MAGVETGREAITPTSFRMSGALELGAGIVASALVLLLPGHGDVTQLEVQKTAFLCLVAVALGRYVVRLERGQLGLIIISTEAAAMALRPTLVLVVALVSSVTAVSRAPQGARHAGFGIRLLWVILPAVAAYVLTLNWPPGRVLTPAMVIAGTTFLNWALTVLEIKLVARERVSLIVRRIFSRPFLYAYIYFGFASFLMASVLDGSWLGYGLASIVAFLSITLTEKMNQQRKRQLAEAQLVDVQRHATYQRAVAGLVHNLRNTLSVTKGYLEDLDELNGSREAGERIAGAKRAADEALSNLARWSKAASPSLEGTAEEFELSLVAEERVGAVRRQAVRSLIEIEIRREPGSCRVRADVVQIGDVVTNLLLNSMDAIGNRGRIVVTTGPGRNGFAMLSVADNGPGVPPDARDRLFEPDFTTKAGGTGIGLFSSFGIVRQHGGELRYETGAQGGAVFTILLPALLPTAAEAIAEPGDSLDPTSVPEGLSRGVDRLVD